MRHQSPNSTQPSYLHNPVAKLPNEILSAIFKLIGEERDPPTPTSPWNLVRVCRARSHLAFATPVLWSKLELVTFSTSFKDPQLATSNQQCSTLGQLERALARSGAALLDVAFSFADDFRPFYRQSFYQLFQTAGSRCSALDFRSVETYWLRQMPEAPLAPVPSLERVRYIRTAPEWHDINLLEAIFDAMEHSKGTIEEAHLVSLMVGGMSDRAWFLNKITNLTCVPYEDMAAVPILRPDTVIETLRLTGAWLIPASRSYRIEPGAVLLPNHRTCWIDNCKLHKLLKHPCTLPSLRRLDIRGENVTKAATQRHPFILDLPNLDTLGLYEAPLVLSSFNAPILSSVALTRNRDDMYTGYLEWPELEEDFYDDVVIASYYRLDDTRKINPTSFTISLIMIQEDTLIMALAQMPAIQRLTLLYPSLADATTRYYGAEFYSRLGVTVLTDTPSASISSCGGRTRPT